MAFMIMLISSHHCFGEIPQYIHFQGLLTDQDSKALHGIYDMEFSFWMSDIGEGSPIWVETHNNVLLYAGSYSIYLGSKSDQPLFEDVDFSTPYYLGIRVKLQGENTWGEYMKNEEGR
jgi:hypothetical protein